MTISVNPATSVISIPKADLTLVTGTLFEHDTEAFRLELIDFEDSELGIVQPRTHTHNTEVTIVGVTYARFIEILSPYSIEYEDGAYSVRLSGSNNNLFDVENGILVQNTVQLIAQNSAGLITISTGSGLDAGQDTKLTRIFNLLDVIEGTFDHAEVMRILLAAMANKLSGAEGTNVKIRDLADTKDRINATVDSTGNRTAVTLDAS